MKRFLATALCFALALSSQPVSVVAAPAKAQKLAAAAGQVTGRAMVDGKPLMNVAVRVRNVDTGEIVGTTTTNTAGEFSFTALSAGQFIVEIVSDRGVILGTSTAVTLTPGAMMANLTVATNAATVAAGGGVAGGFVGGLTTATAGVVASAAGGSVGALLGSTLGIVTLTAATVGVTAAVVATRTSVSGSQ